jgi:hypothetical protein
MKSITRRSAFVALSMSVALVLGLIFAVSASASTYVVYIPLDSPIYDELETLDGAGVLDTYLAEIKPISRMEAARLTLEAERNLRVSEKADALAQRMLKALRAELREEVSWLEQDKEDDLPTMAHPFERVEAQILYSRGKRRQMDNAGIGLIQAQENTPLMPNNDDLATASGSNEVARLSSWAGFGTFLTAYGEGALAGPLTYPYQRVNRARLVRGEIVASFGNFALSAGQEEMWWGTGHFAALSQGNNARTFPALRAQSIHPGYLPGFLRYLGPYRWQVFFGQLEHDRTFSRPWIDGQVLTFKPLPNFEFGVDHAVLFGGHSNDNYSFLGFVGRALAIGTRTTGSPIGANTNQRAGVFLKVHFPTLRNAVLYQEMLAEDNKADLPIMAVSYQGGIYLPRLTDDGLTTARFEWAILEPNYSTHDDPLYWSYKGTLMGDPLGPDASQVDLQLGRWIKYLYKAECGPFYTERAPQRGVPGLHKERGGGFAIDLLRLPTPIGSRQSLWDMRARAAFEYVHGINFSNQPNAFRATISITAALAPGFDSLRWR